MQIDDIVDLGSPPTLIPIQILLNQKNQIKKGLLLDIQINLSAHYTVIKYNDMTALIATLKTMGLIGGLSLVVWFFFKKLC